MCVARSNRPSIMLWPSLAVNGDVGRDWPSRISSMTLYSLLVAHDARIRRVEVDDVGLNLRQRLEHASASSPSPVPRTRRR